MFVLLSWLYICLLDHLRKLNCVGKNKASCIVARFEWTCKALEPHMGKYSLELLMMDGKTVRNMYSVIPK